MLRIKTKAVTLTYNSLKLSIELISLATIKSQNMLSERHVRGSLDVTARRSIDLRR